MEEIAKVNGASSNLLSKRLVIGISSGFCVACAIIYYWNNKITNRITNIWNEKSSTAQKTSACLESRTNSKGSIPKKLDKERLSRFNSKKTPPPVQKKSLLIENKNFSAVKKLFDTRASSKLAEVAQSNEFQRSPSSFTLIPSDNQPIFRLNHLIDFLQYEENIVENGEKALKYQNELEEITNDLLEKMDTSLSGKKKEIANVLSRLAEIKIGKKVLEINRIFGILNGNYSSNNLDLFDNYKYDNSVGEMDTEVLLLLLKSLKNLTSVQAESKLALKNFLENDTNSNECLAKLLMFYLIEFDKNRKNNLKRFKKIEQIKFICLCILNNCLAYLNETSTLQVKDCKFLRTILFESEPIFFTYDESKASSRNSLKNEETVLKKETALVYLKLIDNMLKLYSSSGIEIKKAEVSTNNFISFVLSNQFYDRLEDFNSIESEELQLLNGQIVRILIEFRQRNSSLFEDEASTISTLSNE
jgi:hypothetical protein